MAEPIYTDLTKLAKRTGIPKRILDRMVHRLVKSYNPLRIYLFGSYAWGKPGKYSDLDVCVITATDEEADWERWGEDGGAFDPIDLHVDCPLYSKRKFEEMISSPATMEHRIYKRGYILYTRPDLVFVEDLPMVRIENHWIGVAEDCLKMSRRAFYENDRIRISALFHVQQCIEMSLRALRAFHLQENRKTHDLKKLRHHCQKLDPDFGTPVFFTQGDAKRITRYYYKRYHPGEPIPDDETIQKEIDRAETVMNFVKRKIETTPPPTEPSVLAK